MRLAQALRDDVVGAQRDALLADLRLQMDCVSSCTAPEDSGCLTFSDFLSCRPCRSRACRSAPSRSSGKGSRRSRKAAPASACSGLVCSPQEFTEPLSIFLVQKVRVIKWLEDTSWVPRPSKTRRCEAASSARAAKLSYVRLDVRSTVGVC